MYQCSLCPNRLETRCIRKADEKSTNTKERPDINAWRNTQTEL